MSEQTTPSLLEQLQAHHQAGYLSLHMPGHKENAALAPYLAQLGAEWDITELPGFDDLHAPEGILAKMMDRAAALWGSRKSCLLVNGSTGGLLAAMRGTTRRGDKILVARHCHKAIELCGLDPVFLTPATEPTFGLAGSITPEQVAQALAQHPDVKLIVYPSPTYDGILSDTAGICAIAHEKGIPVLVDEAHGAHLGLHPAFPPSAMGQAAQDAPQPDPDRCPPRHGGAAVPAPGRPAGGHLPVQQPLLPAHGLHGRVHPPAGRAGRRTVLRLESPVGQIRPVGQRPDPGHASR